MSADAAILASAAKVDAAAAFLQSPFLVAQIIEGMQAAVVRANSPWLNRKDAAEYARCSVSEIDRAAANGFIPPHPRGGTPLFEKAEIDEAIKSGKWKQAKRDV